VPIAYLLERDKFRCGICGKRISARLKYPHPMSASIDHVVPLAKGGTHAKENLRPAHLDCNVRKGAGGEGEQLLLVG
jgi:5-methylcytosine-specific restriction endonuclease McrA